MMQQFFQNSFLDGLFSSGIEAPKVETFALPKHNENCNISTFSLLPKSVDNDGVSTFSLFMKKNSLSDIKTTPVLKNERKNQKDTSYYPHSGMGLFFV